MPSSPERVGPDGYFEPVPDEITAYDLPVTGTLPPQLTGVYLRNGPNPREERPTINGGPVVQSLLAQRRVARTWACA
jgi:carotenoid cleavage dioxygenase-like enzyme